MRLTKEEVDRLKQILQSIRLGNYAEPLCQEAFKILTKRRGRRFGWRKYGINED